MAVSVITTLYTGGKPAWKDTFEEATTFQVDDGHLHVISMKSQTKKTLGVYAPGKWVSVFKDDAVKSVKG